MLYSQAIPVIQQYLASFAASDSFEVSIESVFGSGVDRSMLLDIKQQWLSGDFGLMPEVRVLGQGELGTANGAYAASLDQILISADFLDRQQGDMAAVAGLLLEELGHKLDRVFNGAVDTVGDEGAIFRLVVTGADVSPEVLAGLSSVDDRGVIVLDGELVEIERQDFTGTAGNDTIIGTTGNDNISGLDGNDSLRGDAGNDSLSGGSGNDTLEGSVGNNTVNGDADNDLIRSISSGDVIDGGADNDFLSYDFSAQTTGVSISFTNGVGSTSTGGTINNIEQLYFTGSTGNDTVDATSTSFTNAYYFYEPGSELYGGNGNDILRSGIGNDSLRGDAGNDSLSGGSGNDTLEGSVGNNTVNGDADNDLIRSISSGDVIDGGADNDFLSYDFSAQTTGVSISFTNGVGSTSTGGTINNIEQLYFTGSTGNDTVDATSTSFTNAYYFYEPGSELYGGNGNDILRSGIGNDSLRGDAGNDSLSGGSGNDTLEGSVGNNTVNGDADNDLIRSISSGDVIDGGADNDFLSYDFSAQTTGVSIAFTNGVGSTSTGGTINNIEQLYFTGSTGSDTVDATSTSFTNAYYIYEPGSELYGGNGNDILRSGIGNDSLRGDAWNDSLSGGSGNDTLEGSVGNNTVNGDADNDLIRSISLGDVIDGGADNDFLSYDFSAQTTGVSIAFTNGVGSTSTGGTINNIEQLYFTGSTGNDTVDATSTSFTNAYYIYEPGSELYGGNGNDILRSGLGNDSLRGDAGNDSLSGGSGNDTIEGSVGNNTVNGDADNDLIRSISSGDVIDGGADNDFLSYDFSAQTTGVSISFTNGVGSTSTGGTINNIEQLYFTGSTGSDTVDATSTSFTNAYYIYEPGSELYGGNGNDILRSGVGNDSLRGDAGNDLLSGGSGNDTLEGGSDSDTLIGASSISVNPGIGEKDYLTGGLGIDRFILADNYNIYYDDRNITTAGNNDYATIADFNPLQDQIQLQGTASRYLLQVSGTSTNLYIDKAGTEPDELIAVFQNATSLNLTSSAFIYVPPNTQPTAVTLSNITNNLLENTNTTNRLKVADISITDDAFGTNTLSLSGADANFFEIFTGSLYIKADTSLDFETKPNYAVTVAVDDTLIGATPDATTNFNLTLTDVLEVSRRNDFNNDQRADILWRNTTTGEAYIYRQDGLAVISEGSVRTVGLEWQIADTGDFNGDNKADILWRNQTTGDVYIYQMNGSTVASEGSVRTVSLDWQIAGTGDFNGDSKSDILWRNQTTGDVYIYQMNGSAVAGEGSVRTVSLDWQIAGTGDFNGDNKSDILWRNQTTGETYIYQMNGFNVASEQTVRNVSNDWVIEGVDDFNNDGNSDILWRNSNSGNVYGYLMNGFSVASEGSIGQVPIAAGWEVAGTGDNNGDGNGDILWRNTNGSVYSWQLNGLNKLAEGGIRQVSNDWQIASPTI
jgi:Ca2+-binding RTX toxin-like protein